MPSNLERSNRPTEADQPKDTRSIETLVRDHLKDGIIDEREAKELLARYEQDKWTTEESARNSSELLRAELIGAITQKYASQENGSFEEGGIWGFRKIKFVPKNGEARDLTDVSSQHQLSQIGMDSESLTVHLNKRMANVQKGPALSAKETDTALAAAAAEPVVGKDARLDGATASASQPSTPESRARTVRQRKAYDTVSASIGTEGQAGLPTKATIAAFLSDVNANGKSESGKELGWYFGEAQMREAISAMPDAQFDTMLARFGIDKNEFTTNDPAKLTAIRRRFMDAVGVLASSGVPLSNILNNTEKRYMDTRKRQQWETLWTTAENVRDLIDGNEKIRELLAKLPENADKHSILENIRLEGIGVVLGGTNGAGVSFDVKKAVDGWIDSFQLGFVNGMPAIGVTKQLWQSKDERFTVNGSLMNLIPIISASGELVTFKSDEKRLFDKELSAHATLSAYAAISPLSFSVGLGIDASKKNEIKRRTKDMGILLDSVFASAVSGKKTDVASIGIATEELAEFKLLEKRIASFVATVGNDPETIRNLKAGYLKHFENSLYAQAAAGGVFDSGTYLTGGGIGITFLANFLPLPMIGVRGEKISTKFVTKDQLHQKAELLSGETSLTGKLENKERNGKKALFLKGAFHEISAPTGAEIEITDDGVFLGGKIPAGQIRAVKFRDNEGEHVSLIIGEPRIGLDGQLITNEQYGREVKNDVEIVGGTITRHDPKESKGYDESEKIKNVLTTVEALKSKINRRTLDSVPGAKKLENSIANALKTENFTEAWNELIAFQKKYDKIRTIQLPANPSEDEKRIILESVFSSFAKDVYILDKAGVTDEEYASRLKKLEASISRESDGKAFIAGVKKGTIGLRDIGGSDDVATMKRQYVFMTMDLAKFDSNLGIGGGANNRQAAFDRVFGEFVGPENKDAALTATNASRASYMKQHFEGRTHFTSGLYAGGDLITFPVSSQIDANGRRFHAGMTPITGAVEMAQSKDGKFEFETIQSPEVRNALIDKMPKRVLEAILSVLKAQKVPGIATTADVANLMKSGKTIPGTKEKYVDFDAVFFKWGDCFNDAYGIKDLRIKYPCGYNPDGTPIIGSCDVQMTSSEVNIMAEQENSVVKLALGFTGKLEEKTKTTDTNTEGANTTTEPGSSQETGETAKPNPNPNVSTAPTSTFTTGTPAQPTVTTTNLNPGWNE